MRGQHRLSAVCRGSPGEPGSSAPFFSAPTDFFLTVTRIFFNALLLSYTIREGLEYIKKNVLKGKLFSNEISTISCSRLLDIGDVIHNIPVSRPERKSNCVPHRSHRPLGLYEERYQAK